MFHEARRLPLPPDPTPGALLSTLLTGIHRHSQTECHRPQGGQSSRGLAGAGEGAWPGELLI